MSEKRFIIVKSIENLYALVDKEKEVEQIIIFSLHKEQLDVVCDLLNEQQATITHLEKVNGKNFAKRRLLEQDNLVLRNENEQLRKQIQNYEKLIANSYVGEEERLDGFVGQYVIWEDELQKYKNKNEMIDNE